MKGFRQQIQFFEQKLRSKEPFAFVRYSDGEMGILMGWYTELSDKIKFGTPDNMRHINYAYPPEDHKLFDPKKHGFYKDKLTDSLLFEKKGYYKGIISGCQDQEMYNAQFKILNKTIEEVTNDESFTYADLFVNSNYPYFIQNLLPQFFNYKTVIICNENANIDTLPFPVVKDFRVGYNCFINDHDIIKDIKQYISSNNIENHLFLFSASSLSEVAIHELYNFNDKNTYLDIGTCLNIFLGLTIDRNYLRGFWLNSGEADIHNVNQWLRKP